jgi:hypothetical protein
MSRIRLNQEYRNKIANRMRVHLEQENTQEKEKFFQLRESFLDKQNKTWELAQQCVTRQYPKKDVKNGTLSSRQISKCKYYCKR